MTADGEAPTRKAPDPCIPVWPDPVQQRGALFGHCRDEAYVHVMTLAFIDT
jgi:hypothetical protein